MQQSLPNYRWWDVRAALLLLVALFAVASRLTATRWTEHLEISYVIAFFGLAAGLALGQSKFRLRTVLLFTFVYGAFVVPWQMGNTLGTGIEWSERMLSLAGRLSYSAAQFVQQRPVQDPILAQLLFAMLFWILSAQAGYAITRHADPWQATLPGGLALLVIHTYDFRPQGGAQFTTLLWALSIYFIVSLLLLARLNYLKRRQLWETHRVHFAPEVDTDILQATFIATIVLVVMAWAAPLTPSVLPPARDMWKIVSRPWNDIRSRFGNAFTSLQASFGVVDDSYTDQLNLGRGNTLSDSVVLQVEAPARPPGGARYYWRAWVYDTYDSGRWRNTFSLTQSVTPDGFDFQFPSYQARWTGVVSITPAVPIGTLYTPAQPQWVSRPVRATLEKDDEGNADIGAVQAAVTVFAGETYRVYGSLSTASVTQLRSAGERYPQWVMDRYLQLPAITDRTRALAQDIAAPYDNAYDITEAVTQYLRDNIEYADVIPAPPPAQEPVDWFLFDLKQGFCNYYATAEVVMLRSLGIPARMAVGYARGRAENPVDQTGPGPVFGDVLDASEPVTFTVLQRDAHAWPEVYFPDYGWVEFEPTVSQSPISRPLGGPVAQGTQAAPTPGPDDAADQLQSEKERDPNASNGETDSRPAWVIVLWLLIPLGIVALGFAGWKVRSRINLPPLAVVMERSLRRMGLTPPAALREWARMASLPPIEKAYQEVNSALVRLGSPPTPADTPSERVAALRRVLPDAATYAHSLLAEYHATAYGQESGNAAAAVQAGRLIRNLSWREFVSRKVSGERAETTVRYAGWRA